MQRKSQEGFTLIELLIAIVVVGVLTAVAIVGIGSLTDEGETSACSATQDAAKAAAVVYYANNNSTWPATVGAMTGGANPELELGNTTVAGNVISGNGWTLTMTAGSPPTWSTC